MDLQHAEHHVTRLEYHLVFTPKYRCRAFRPPYTTVLKQLFIRAAYDYDMEVRAIEIPPDHVHTLVAIPPQTCVSEAVRVLKSLAARELFKRHPEFKRKFFWSGKLWSPSYYAETIGRVDEAAIERYIRAQLKEEGKMLTRTKQLKLV